VDRQNHVGAVAVHFDSQFTVMTLQPEKGGAGLFWAQRTLLDPVRWRALRRAVYADHGAELSSNGTTVHASLRVPVSTESEGSPPRQLVKQIAMPCWCNALPPVSVRLWSCW
jgi:hypothetical protein